MSDGCAKVVNSGAEKAELLRTSVAKMKLNIRDNHITMSKSFILQ